MHILLVEDDNETASYLMKGLKESGHIVDRASDGKEGLFMAFDSNYDAGTGGPVDSNGDDQIAVVTSDVVSFNSSSYTVVDMFGVAGEDGSGTEHEFEDGRAERDSDVN